MWIAVQKLQGGINAWMLDGDSVKELHVTSGRTNPSDEELFLSLAQNLTEDTATLVVCAGVDAAPMSAVPAAVLPPRQITSSDPRLALFPMPRLTQTQPVDALQGEEATIAGFIAAYPDWDGVLCIVGASTRWVHISAGEIVSFRSFLTGEIFGLLAANSSMKAALAGEGWDAEAFDAAVTDAMSRPERIASSLASIRAQTLISGAQPATARARLSGTLIGIELAAARAYWLGQNIAVIGEGLNSECYAAALKGQGAMMQRDSGRALALNGLRDAYSKLRKN